MTINNAKALSAALLAGALALAGCSATAGAAAVESSTPAPSITEPAGGATSSGGVAGSTAPAGATATEGTLFDAGTLHTISVDIPADTLADVLQTYADTGDKKWAKATVTIDGVTYQDAGIKLKGNSSLRGVNTSSKAETLPWRIRLDKYVDSQNAGGYTDFTIRGNNTETSMNEAVALDLLGTAGLATELAAETSFSVNGSDATLRLAVQNLDGTWVTQNFPDAGADSVLYKSDADGDWSWRGDDGDYTSSFDIEAGPDDYQPLIELLDLLNNGTDAEKAEKLPQLVDLDSFATYLAFEDLIGNFDDIDGPGNNSYLFWDSATGMFTVVAWDHNMAFGGGPGGMGGPGAGDRPGRPGAADGTQPGPAGASGAGQGSTSDTTTGAPDAGQGSGEGGVTPTGAPEGWAPPDGWTPPTDGTFPTDLPEGMTPPTDGFPAPGAAGGQFPNGQGGRGGVPGGKANPLVDAFNAVAEWADMKTEAAKQLQEKLIDAGARDSAVEQWENLLKKSATGLVDADTITKEADAIRDFTPAS